VAAASAGDTTGPGRPTRAAMRAANSQSTMTSTGGVGVWVAAIPPPYVAAAAAYPGPRPVPDPVPDPLAPVSAL
jgi:hypothetical protein